MYAHRPTVLNLPLSCIFILRVSPKRAFLWNTVFCGYPFCIMKENLSLHSSPVTFMLYLVKNESTYFWNDILSPFFGLCAVTATMIVPAVADSKVSSNRALGPLSAAAYVSKRCLFFVLHVSGSSSKSVTPRFLSILSDA